MASRKCSAEEVSALQKEVDCWLTETVALVLSSLLLKVILVNQVMFSDLSRAAKNTEISLKLKVDELELELHKQKVQYNQKAQECQSLRIELSRVVTTPFRHGSNITSGFTRSASVAPTPPTSSASVAPTYPPHSGSTFLARIPAVPSSRSSTTVSPSLMLMSQEQPPPLPPGDRWPAAPTASIGMPYASTIVRPPAPPAAPRPLGPPHLPPNLLSLHQENP
ncbi:hypothetical protein BGY98DRAFT_948456 [Russula aff. rugulosa BPL654]|nr:hypothetical protein BGY98DRAFT_948456 [Russula aff. rugulosa BPL654]